MTFLGSGAASILTHAQADPGQDAVGALITAALAALLKVVFYLSARTGAPIDGASTTTGRPPR